MSTFQLRGGNGGEGDGRWTFVLCDGEHVNVVTGRMCDSRAEAVAHMEAVRAWPHTNVHLERHATQGAGTREGRHYFTLGETGFPTLATSNYYGTKHALELAILRFEMYVRDATMLEDGESPAPPHVVIPHPHPPPPRSSSRACGGGGPGV